MSVSESLFDKLQFNDEKNLLIQGLPSSIEKQFAKLSYSKNVTPLLKTKKVDFALVFAVNFNQLCSILRDVLPALHNESKLWVAYPKTTSKIVSDLNRDCSWDILSSNGYEGIRQVTLDHVWTAMRWQKTAQAAPKARPAESKRHDFEKTLVSPPAELENFFLKHSKAKDFFTSLPPVHQEVYVSWISGAKRAETRKRRAETATERLLEGKLSPM
ncbi:MAG TPA: YdeI/OmpD-associated family protein [Chitinophagaceae bacterium]